jgi:hypothetical protein
MLAEAVALSVESIPWNGYSQELLNALCLDAYRRSEPASSYERCEVRWRSDLRKKRIAEVMVYPSGGKPAEMEFLKVGPLAQIKKEVENWGRLEGRLFLDDVVLCALRKDFSQSEVDFAGAVRIWWGTACSGKMPVDWLAFVRGSDDGDEDQTNARLGQLAPLMKDLKNAIRIFHSVTNASPDRASKFEPSKAYACLLPRPRFDRTTKPYDLKRAIREANEQSEWSIYCVDPSHTDSTKGILVLRNSQDIYAELPVVAGDKDRWCVELWAAGVAEGVRISDVCLRPQTGPREILLDRIGALAKAVELSVGEDHISCGKAETVRFTNPMGLLTPNWPTEFGWRPQVVATDIHGDLHLGNVVSRFSEDPAALGTPLVKLIDVADSASHFPASLDFAALELSLKIQVVEDLLRKRLPPGGPYVPARDALVRMMVEVEAFLWGGAKPTLAGLDEWSQRVVGSALVLLGGIREMAHEELSHAPVKCRGSCEHWSAQEDLAQSLYFCGLGTLRYEKDIATETEGGTILAPPLWGLVTAGFAADRLAPTPSPVVQ